MSRAYLNYEVSPELQCRRDRRKRFRERFLQLPYGMFDVQEFAKNLGIPWRTALAYLRELRCEGLVNHNVVKRCKWGLKLDTPVWSRIK